MLLSLHGFNEVEFLGMNARGKEVGLRCFQPGRPFSQLEVFRLDAEVCIELGSS